MAGALARAIALPQDAPPAVHTAARELQGALERAGGPPLPIVAAGGAAGPVFAVGIAAPGEGDPTAPDACRVARRGDRLHLWGQGPRGALHAVHALLQDVLGFRWPAPDLEVLPRLPQPEQLPEADLLQEPSFPVRDVGYREALQAPWGSRLRLNGDFAARALGPEWGGGMRYARFVHTFYALVPPVRYFARHPEYFSLVDGRRRESHAQLCLTNPDIVGIAAREVSAWFAADPQATIASVSQNDWLGACECPECRALAEREGSEVGPVLHFANAVAREVARSHPDRLIDTLAYWYTEDPPRNLRPAPNVVVRLCHMSPSCESHAVEACPRNAPFAARLQAWSRIAPRLHIWDYQTNFSHLLMPFPNFAAIAADLALFRRRGVESMFCQGDLEVGGGGEWSTLRAHYLARLLWDATLDPEALVEEHLAAAFPAARRPVRAYFDLIQAQARDPERHVRMFSPVQAGHLPDPTLDAAAAALTAAARLAGEGAEAERVRRLRLSLDYVRLAMPPAFALEGDRLVPRPPADAGAGFLPAAERPAALAAFLSELERQGIRALREARPVAEFVRRAQTLAGEHPAPLRRCGGFRLRLVPDLGGRIWSLVFAGRELLAPPTAADGDYPAAGGYEESCAGDLGRTEAHALETLEADGSVVLSATVAGMANWHEYEGVAVRRRIAAEGTDGLALSTEVGNAGNTPHTLAIRPRLRLAGPVSGLAWCDAAGVWAEAGWDPAVASATVARGTSGWRARVGDLEFICRHDPVDRVRIESHPWGWWVECVGVERPVPPGERISFHQHWRARVADAG